MNDWALILECEVESKTSAEILDMIRELRLVAKKHAFRIRGYGTTENIRAALNGIARGLESDEK